MPTKSPETEIQTLLISLLLLHNKLYICIRIKQNNDENDFLHNIKLYINAHQTCKGIVKIYFMFDVSEIQETYTFQQN